jgi:diguanylate cyclase (GGDEF)-like protein
MQTLWLEAPMFCFGCSIMMLYVYITSLNDQVSIDELTKLNNRTQLKKYVASEAQKQSSDKYDRYVLMVDLNKFKQINDQYGHVEGDYALKRTADALKLSCSENPMRTFIARYGGDEFIIIAKTDKEENIKALCQSIRDNLKHLNKKAGAEYELTASIGYSPYSGDIASFQAALAKADDYLYKEKGARGPVK